MSTHKKKRKPARRRKRKCAPLPARIVSDEVIRQIHVAFYDSVRERFWRLRLPVGHVAAEIGLSRQGLTKVLRRRSKALQFGTFLRACFLEAGSDSRIVIDSEGWKIELWWAVTRSNGSYVSEPEARA